MSETHPSRSRRMHPLKLLYVEDDENLREQFLIFFQRRFSETIQASNGKIGLEMFEKHRPDIIITDVQMPEMNGLEMIKAIREISQDVQIIITSAFDESNFFQRAIKLGVNRYVIKPIIKSQIEEAIESTTDIIYARQMRKQKEEMLQSLLDSQPNMIFLGDVKEIRAVNRVFLEFFGCGDLEEFRAKYHSISNLFLDGEDFLRASPDWLSQILEKKCDCYVMMKNLEEEKRVFRVKANPFLSDEKLYAVVFSDETEMFWNAKEMEQKVLEETEKRLKQEEVMLQQSRQATMGEMIGNIAHQMKQPLYILNLHTELLQDDFAEGVLNEEGMNRYAQEVFNQTDYMNQTITTFRNFLKPSEKTQSFDLISETKEVFKLLGAVMSKKGISLRLFIDHHPIDLSADDPQGQTILCVSGNSNEFKQVLMNLLTNARDALETSNKSRSIEEKREGEVKIMAEDADERVLLRVRDNAGGIDAEVMQHLFEPYVTTKGEGGTGIGLYMSFRILQKMGGRIEAENIEDGAEFRLYLQKADEKQCTERNLREPG